MCKYWRVLMEVVCIVPLISMVMIMGGVRPILAGMGLD